MRLIVALVTYATLLMALANRVVAYVRPAWSSWPPPVDGRVLPWPVRLMEKSFGVAQIGTLALAGLDWSAVAVPTPVRLVGALAFAAGGGWALWGVATLGGDATLGSERDLEARGPYRFSRNPQYSATIVVAWGLAAMAASALTAIAAVGITVVMIALPFVEEPWLRDRLGPPYDRYCDTTPRFVPRPPT